MLLPLIAVVFACTIWGLSGLYYVNLIGISTFEILAHRALWSLIFFALFILVFGKISNIIKAFKSTKVVIFLSISALMITLNWFCFIYAIQSGNAVQASFGYYIFPLVAVFFGYIFFGERFSKHELLAILLATSSVIGLGFALDVFPGVALLIALSFGLYGVVKRAITLGAVESVAMEALLLAPFSVSYLLFLYFSENYQLQANGLKDYFFLAFSGVLTGGPLILFSYATQILRYSSIGLIQYINPTLQFLVAIFIFFEPYNNWHSLALIFVWLALILYSYQTIMPFSKR